MLQVTGHGKDVFDQQYQAAVTEFINREKKCIKRWEMKYKPMFEKKWKEHKKRYLNKPQKVGRTVGRIQSTSEPTVRCIGWGITKLDKRTADKEIACGALSDYKDGEEYYANPSEHKRSIHGRTKALSTAFYDTNGIYSFGGEVIRKQGHEIEKNHNREMLRIENLRRRMGMYENQDSVPGDPKEGEPQVGGEEEPIEPCLSNVSDPIEDLVDRTELELEEELLASVPQEEAVVEEEVQVVEEEKRRHVPVIVPELEMDKVSQRSGKASQRSQRSQRSQKSSSRRSQRSSRRGSARGREEGEEKKKKESVFKRAQRPKKKKMQKRSAFNSYGNPLFPRFAHDTPRSTTSSTTSRSSARRKKKKGRSTPRHEEIMRKLEARMEVKRYGM